MLYHTVGLPLAALLALVAAGALLDAPGQTAREAILPELVERAGTTIERGASLLDGVSRGACPVRLNLEPGQHEVRFVFEPTGESRGERFSVKANERVTVRAEFTGASPTVRIQH